MFSLFYILSIQTIIDYFLIITFFLANVYITSFLFIILVKSFSMYNINKSVNLSYPMDTFSQVLIFLKAEKEHSHIAELMGSVKATLN